MTKKKTNVDLHSLLPLVVSICTLLSVFWAVPKYFADLEAGQKDNHNEISYLKIALTQERNERDKQLDLIMFQMKRIEAKVDSLLVNNKR